MQNLRFLFSRKWLVFALVVAALAWGAWWLGEWQFHRLDDRRERNAVIRANEAQEPVAPGEVMRVGEQPAADVEWREVTARGTYAVEDTVIVRYRTRDGAPGVNVVVPLVLPDGTSMLVDRGWYATSNRGATSADVPAPPPGPVEVVAWVRLDATGAATKVSQQSTRAISSSAIAEALDREVLGGFTELVSESPEPAEPLVAADLPELNEGPHFFYGLQWWFFGALAVFGFGYLLLDEYRGGRGPWGRRRTRGEDSPAANTGPNPARSGSGATVSPGSGSD